MEIRPYEKNAKKHTPDQVEKIAASIKAFGMNQPIVVDKDGVIIVGHGRYEALKLLGWEIKPEWVITVKNLTDEQVAAYRLADNKLNESEWDMTLALAELKDLSEEAFALTGFDKDLLIDKDKKDDEVPVVADRAESEFGDLYELGPHRILCGDATRVESMERLMGGGLADMVFTDPPYNVNYEGTGENTSTTMLNDKMSDADFADFLVGSFKQIAKAVKRTAGCYIFHSHKTATDFDLALRATGFTIDTQLIWNKPSAGLGANHYRTKHEPFYYCSLGEEKEFYGDRTGTTVWKVPDDPEKALKWFMTEVAKQEEGESTIWTMRRANVNEYVHPTQKPVELAVTAIVKSSKRDEIVLDPFLGSGTTLIAATKSGRRCYGMELDPKYIDVCISRWVEYTGNNEITKNGEKIIWNTKS